MTVYQSLIASALTHFKFDEVAGDVAKDENRRAGWVGFTNSDYLKADGIGYDFSETVLRIKFVADRDSVIQCLASQYYVSPWSLRLDDDGRLRISVRDGAGNVKHIYFADLDDGELADYSIAIKSTSDEVVVTNNLTSSTQMYTQSLSDSYAFSGEVFIGKYAGSNISPSTKAKIELFEIKHGGVLVHSWDFSKSTFKDQVGNKDLTIFGALTFDGAQFVNLDTATASVPGLLSDGGTAIAFDGVNQYVDIGNRAATAEQTLGFWVMPVGNTGHVLQYGKTAVEIKPSTDVVTYWPDTDSASIDFACDLSSAVHIGIGQVGTSATLFCNGVAGETKPVVAINTTAASSYLGSNGSTYFGGTLDSVTVFDRVLTQEEAYLLKSFQPSVLLSCDLQETSGSEFLDASGHGNDATAQGGLDAGQHSVPGPGGLFASAIGLDGTSHFLSLPDIPILGAWTCSIWTNGRHADRSSVLFGKNDRNEKAEFYAGKEQMLCRADNGSSACVAPIDVNTFGWHLYTFVRESNNDLRLYVDATDQGVIGTSIGAVTHFNQVGLDDAGNYHSAAIAGVLIADYPLSAQEVAARYALAFEESILPSQPRDFLKVKQVRRFFVL